MQNIRMTGIKMLRGTRRICLLDLIAAHPSGSINRLARMKIRKTAVDELRVLQEYGRSRIHAFHVEHADDDGGDGIAGMPNTSAGIQAPPRAELLADVASTMPSIWPVPNFSGSAREFLRHRVGNPRGDVGAGAGQGADEHADGRAANEIEPVALPDVPDADEDIADLLRRTPPRSGRRPTTPRSSSETANIPIIAGMKLMPCRSSTLPKVNRGKPAAGSMPMQLMASPSSSDATPFSGASVVMKIAQVNPSSASQKYSNDEKWMANSASAGAQTMRMATPTSPPITENTRLTPEVEVELALARHGIALVGVGGRRRRSGDAQHRGRNVAGEDRHGGRGDDGAERRDRGHEEGDRDEQRRRHGRGQAGHRADENAERRRGQDHPQDERVEDELGRRDQRVHVVLTGSR